MSTVRALIIELHLNDIDLAVFCEEQNLTFNLISLIISPNKLFH